MKIDILLSTYNGEKHLEELINSILNQSYSNFNIIIRDDGSTDKTFEILEQFRKRFPDKIKILDKFYLNLKPKDSYAELLLRSTADYIMFCDQDDVWLPDKIKITMNRMEEIEQINPNIPILVFTDLIVTDENLNIINNSFWKYSKIDPKNVDNIYRLSVNNPIAGCTVMINRKSKTIILPIPEKAIMHDWWIALKIKQNGIISVINEPTILYRQHVKNAVGAARINRVYYLSKMFQISKVIRSNFEIFSMLKLLNIKASFLKYIWYKILITFNKI